MSSESRNESKLLRVSLRGNGTFSVVSGLAFVIGASSIAEFIGIDTPWIVTTIGVSLLVFAVGLFMNSFRANVNLIEARIAVALDFLWVLGSGVVIALGLLSTGGNWGVGIVADVVLLFAILQFVGVRRVTLALAD